MTNPARLRRLTLTNFRSYHAATLAVGDGPVVLVGPNGAGKTNLLEAISFLAPGRGLRRAPLEEAAVIEPPTSEDAAPARKCRIDREPAASATAFADHLRVIWLVPAMDGLFAGPGAERRRFIDRLGGRGGR